MIDESSAKALSAISAPVKALIEKFSIGRLYDHVYISKMNKAENKGRIRDAQTDLEIARIKAEEMLVNEQINVNAVVSMAAQLLPPSARPEEVDKDWVSRATDKMKVVTDADMQTLWAKIVAGEAESPGRFSYRVLEEVSMLSKSEAKSFTELAGYVWTWRQLNRPIVVTNEPNHDLWRPNSPLRNTNLIKYTYPVRTTYHAKDDAVGATICMEYHGRPCFVKLNQNRATFSEGIDLTAIGEVLFPLCGGGPIAGEYERVVERWKGESQFDVAFTS